MQTHPVGDMQGGDSREPRRGPKPKGCEPARSGGVGLVIVVFRALLAAMKRGEHPYMKADAVNTTYWRRRREREQSSLAANRIRSGEYAAQRISLAKAIV